MLSFHFSTALYAASVADPDGLAAKLRFTLRVCLLGGLAGVPLVIAIAHPLLRVFGPQYAARATLPLVVMITGYFGSVLKNNYVALLRIADKITKAAVYSTLTCVIRLAAMTAGALADGLTGVSVALLVSMCAEGLYTIPALRAALNGERQAEPPTAAAWPGAQVAPASLRSPRRQALRRLDQKQVHPPQDPRDGGCPPRRWPAARTGQGSLTWMKTLSSSTSSMRGSGGGRRNGTSHVHEGSGLWRASATQTTGAGGNALLVLPGERQTASARDGQRGPMTQANRTAIAVAVMAAGVLLISVSYAAGRAGASGAGHGAAVAAFWLGEAAIFAVPAALVLGRREPGEAQAAWLTVALATATYLVKYLYSPSFFEFSDEFLHLRTLTSLLASHHLFGANYALPVSPGYPGLEIVTSGLMDLTGLSAFPAGLIVAGLAHLVFTTALYTLFRLVGGTTRIGLAAVAIYAANPHYQVFDAIFGYQTLALAFFALALLAMYKATRPDTSRPRVITAWTLAAVFTAATAVTHHVTSYVLAGTAVLIAAAALLAGGRKNLAAPACFAAGVVALAVAVDLAVRPGHGELPVPRDEPARRRRPLRPYRAPGENGRPPRHCPRRRPTRPRATPWRC